LGIGNDIVFTTANSLVNNITKDKRLMANSNLVSTLYFDGVDDMIDNIAMKDFYVQEAFTIGGAGSSTFKTGDTISLKGDNDKYLNRIIRGNLDPIEATNNAIDPYSKFVVTVLADGTIALKADNGKYLSRIIRGNLDPIEAMEAAKDSIDAYSQFNVTVLADGKIVLKADNDKYLSRINRGRINPIEATKNTSDVFFQCVVS